MLSIKPDTCDITIYNLNYYSVLESPPEKLIVTIYKRFPNNNNALKINILKPNKRNSFYHSGNCSIF